MALLNVLCYLTYNPHTTQDGFLSQEDKAAASSTPLPEITESKQPSSLSTHIPVHIQYIIVAGDLVRFLLVLLQHPPENQHIWQHGEHSTNICRIANFRHLCLSNTSTSKGHPRFIQDPVSSGCLWFFLTNYLLAPSHVRDGGRLCEIQYRLRSCGRIFVTGLVPFLGGN